MDFNNELKRQMNERAVVEAQYSKLFSENQHLTARLEKAKHLEFDLKREVEDLKHERRNRTDLELDLWTEIRTLKQKLEKEKDQRTALEARWATVGETVLELTATLEKEANRRAELEASNQQHVDQLEEYKRHCQKITQSLDVRTADNEELQRLVQAQDRNHKEALKHKEERHSATVIDLISKHRATISEQTLFYEKQLAELVRSTR